MRQRAMIAMALANEPKLLIADEPTTAFDVTVQAQILALLQDLQDRLGMAIIIITHDLGVVAEITDEICVMYAGRIVEHASTDEIFAAPEHPYTWGLLDIYSAARQAARRRSRADLRAPPQPDPAAVGVLLSPPLPVRAEAPSHRGPAAGAIAGQRPSPGRLPAGADHPAPDLERVSRLVVTRHRCVSSPGTDIRRGRPRSYPPLR